MISRIYRKIGDAFNPALASKRAKRLQNRDFTIISNNCWAGSVYRRYGLPYLTPTAGLYFFADDFVRFASRLKYYTSLPLEFIDVEQSDNKELLLAKGQEDKPIGRLDDVEIIFLHYHSVQEANEKWVRRCQRINWDNIFIKNAKMNNCTEDDLQRFDSIAFDNKICFVPERTPTIECGVYFPAKKGCDNISNDTDYYCRFFDVDKWLNNNPVPYLLG